VTPNPLPADAVVVLVGAPASGKTTLRRQLLAAGAGPTAVLSPDDERARLRDEDVADGRVPRPLQDYSLSAIRRCEAAASALLGEGRGYVYDATGLRRRDRVLQVRAAHEARLAAIALLLPALPLGVLTERNARRPDDRRVPEEILARHAHRRSLLSAELLLEEGFDDVIEVGASPAGPSA